MIIIHHRFGQGGIFYKFERKIIFLGTKGQKKTVTHCDGSQEKPVLCFLAVLLGSLLLSFGFFLLCLFDELKNNHFSCIP